MKEVLSYELGDLPYSLATHSGSLVKTTKSKLLQALLVDTENIAGIPKEAVVILDGMAVLQSTKPTGDTFGALATQLLVSVLSNVPEDGRVDFVCDQYPTCSIKSAERQRRAQSTAPVVRITGPEQRLPQWKTFMSVSCPLHISRSDAPIGLRCSRRQFGTKPSDVASAHHSHWPNGAQCVHSRRLVRGSRTILYDSLVGTVKESYLLQLSVN